MQLSDRDILHSAPPGHMILQFASGQTSAFELPLDWSDIGTDHEHVVEEGAHTHLRNRDDSTGSHSAASFYLYIPSTHPISRRARNEDRAKHPEGIDTEQLPSRSDDNSINPSSAVRSPQHNVRPGHMTGREFPLVVLIHGSRRDAQGLRDLWSDFAEERQVVLLCPLFPATLSTLDGIHNYKILSHLGNRYDILLLRMITYVAFTWGSIGIGIDIGNGTGTSKRDGRKRKMGIHISGFSGGAQFVHRFAFLHPDLIASLTIAAPGGVTLLDEGLAWPRGLGAGVPHVCAQEERQDSAEAESKEEMDEPGRGHVQRIAHYLSCVPVGMFLGDEDKARVKPVDDLRRSLEEHGIPVHFERVPGAAHEEGKLAPVMQRFMGRSLSRARGEECPSKTA